MKLNIDKKYQIVQKFVPIVLYQLYCSEGYLEFLDIQFSRLFFVVITSLIVSITKFSILIGSPRAYLSRNWRAITWVSDYSCPI